MGIEKAGFKNGPAFLWSFQPIIVALQRLQIYLLIGDICEGAGPKWSRITVGRL